MHGAAWGLALPTPSLCLPVQDPVAAVGRGAQTCLPLTADLASSRWACFVGTQDAGTLGPWVQQQTPKQGLEGQIVRVKCGFPQAASERPSVHYESEAKAAMETPRDAKDICLPRGSAGRGWSPQEREAGWASPGKATGRLPQDLGAQACCVPCVLDMIRRTRHVSCWVSAALVQSFLDVLLSPSCTGMFTAYVGGM